MSTNSFPVNLTSVLSSIFFEECLNSTASSVIFTSYTCVNLLFLLPLCVSVLFVGLQRWRLRRSMSSNHSDFFTYHIVIVEITGVLGSVAYVVGIFCDSMPAVLSGIYISSITFPGQTLFHCLTCVEHYLAVIHPIAYMRQRETGGGVRVRNVIVACVWLLCAGWILVMKASLPDVPTLPLLCMFGISTVLVCFCCLSVLRALTHPGPGEVSGNKERVDHSKRRAFQVMCTILGVLLLKFAALLVSFSLLYLEEVDVLTQCAMVDGGICFTLPGSLILPLLFLHRTGKLGCCRRNQETGPGLK